MLFTAVSICKQENDVIEKDPKKLLMRLLVDSRNASEVGVEHIIGVETQIMLTIG